ncbi:MAG TPA: signal peptidase I [Actinomycetota bacterium]|nr:signal peptidase I [Actinomycetota bacterium]
MGERRPGAGRRPAEPIGQGGTAHTDTAPLDVRPVERTEPEVRPRVRKAPRRGKHEPRGPLAFLRELPGLILIAFGLALLIKTFLIQAFFIPSRSMLPTLQVGDRVIVNKFVYDFGEPQRGDVIVFENPALPEPDRNPLEAAWHWLIEGLGFTSDPNKDFIKRVIGVPGDVVEIKNGIVFVNGERQREPYVAAQKDRSDMPPTKVRAEKVFVMGDNRPNSQDSRNIGQIPYDNIVGKAFVLLWPPSRIEWLSDV